MVVTINECSCNKHPENPDGKCGNKYIFHGHLGWGEPYSRVRLCPLCDACSNKKGIECLSPEKRDVGKWVNSDDGPINQFGKFFAISIDCSYTIKVRLPNLFRQTLNELISGHPKGHEPHYFAFDSELGTYFYLNHNTKTVEVKTEPHYHPAESGSVMAIDPDVMEMEINQQQVDCPICADGTKLGLMMHEGWIRHPSVGYDSTPRPYRIFYLSCRPEWKFHNPNNPVMSNYGERPFNDHPIITHPWASFWSSKPEYPKK